MIETEFWVTSPSPHSLLPTPFNDGSNNVKFRENFGDFPPDMTMKILSLAIALNNRVVLKPLLKMGFTMVLKSMEKYLTIFQKKG
nr:hypothetical protein [Coleofasciculus sp. LEGE 07092]